MYLFQLFFFLVPEANDNLQNAMKTGVTRFYLTLQNFGVNVDSFNIIETLIISSSNNFRLWCGFKCKRNKICIFTIPCFINYFNLQNITITRRVLNPCSLIPWLLFKLQARFADVAIPKSVICYVDFPCLIPFTLTKSIFNK